jgi:hypothetical protein
MPARVPGRFLSGRTELGTLAGWLVTAHHGHDCLAGLEGERPRTVEDTGQSFHA